MKTKEEWFEFYSRPEQFCRIFHDRAFLRAAAAKGELSGGEKARLEACEERIDAYLN